MILLDTHAWIWFNGQDHNLSPRAVQAIRDVESLVISAISFWELSLLLSNRRLQLPRGTEEWLNEASEARRVRVIPVDQHIAWLAASEQLAWDHRDPADRILVATALTFSCPIVSADERIRSFTPVQTIW